MKNRVPGNAFFFESGHPDLGNRESMPMDGNLGVLGPVISAIAPCDGLNEGTTGRLLNHLRPFAPTPGSYFPNGALGWQLPLFPILLVNQGIRKIVIDELHLLGIKFQTLVNPVRNFP